MRPDPEIRMLSDRAGSPLPVRVPVALLPWMSAATIRWTVWLIVLFWAGTAIALAAAVIASVKSRRAGVKLRRFLLGGRAEWRFWLWLSFVPFRGAHAAEWLVLGVFLVGYVVFLALLFAPAR